MRRLILAVVLLSGLGAAVPLIAGFSDPAKALHGFGLQERKLARLNHGESRHVAFFVTP